MNLAHLAKTLSGDVAGRGRVLCPGPGHSAHDRSLSVTLSGRDFLVHSFAGDDWQTCRDYVREMLGLTETGRFTRPSETELRQVREADEQYARKQEARARECWVEAVPISGTLAEVYLRGRVITCPLPETLRFHPRCYHPSTARLPAMVAMIEGAERFAIHRTYLDPVTRGKASIDPEKAMLGSVGGGAVRLNASGYRLVVCEGIETGLSLASGLVNGSPTVWAGLSTSGMKRLVLPPQPGRLLIATDGDDSGRAAGNNLGERAAALGWQVSLLPAPDGRDWNDVLKMKGN
ncbi:toprim domain-containing protein [Sinorhizobium meliloti]|uniref:DUF7146 domain-containing protein n=1 Tax=Rhizobium meliloti TaxID=382 RepID=UPI000FD8321F|nr:toprim domain-containing protein [Sinorhizobium meliloti]RVG89297.1 hypothetical protein CN219_02335 [Sinorhizobium meliloti]RVI33954.1 hypothetical protein CN197_16910 [Sinorhizobium meliloti]RVI45062.1 hypothetical protein CN196_13935 [Sinorhizobium meliloti]RVJ30169.1 hypothetical protein CN177_03730 [Sinorhizobium meliloti]RVK03074.1 hypothetical protein CN170_05405 [Sinorhizobium meliloti]